MIELYTCILYIFIVGNVGEDKVLLVRSGATLEIHGSHKQSWTRLAETAVKFKSSGGIIVEQEVPLYISYTILSNYSNIKNRIDGVMLSVFASSDVDRGFEPRWGEINDYKISMCCFSAEQTALRRKIKGWLVRNQDNAFEWSYMSNRGLLFQ